MILSLASVPAARADLPGWLRKHNSDVDDGNEALVKGDPKGALESYNRAARALPDAPGLQLDRGIALLKQGEYSKARESLLAATVPNTSKNVRADAYHNLALSFYREADGLAGQDEHEDAQKLFREAVDAAKRSLHLRPGHADTAWNLELAARRMREEEQKKKEADEQKKQDQQDQDQQQQDQQDQDQQQDQQNQDQPQQDQQDQDQQKQDQQNQDSSKQNDQQDDQQKPEQDPSKQDQPQQPEPQDQDSQKPSEAQDEAEQPALPREAEQALDALENNEENFERYRARQRANRERRAPEKDW